MASHDFELKTYLEKLRDSGKIDNGELNVALQLAAELKPKCDIVVPGMITIRKKLVSRGELAAVAAVFNVAELAENILTRLSSSDLANGIVLTCRGFKDYVEASIDLRRELFLVPDMSRTIKNPRCPKIKGVHYCATPAYIECLITKFQDLIEQCPRFHNVFIMQPPPTTLEVTYNTGAHHIPHGFVDNKDGITFGFLWAAISRHFKWWQKHRASRLTEPNPRVLEAHLILRIPDGDCSHDP